MGGLSWGGGGYKKGETPPRVNFISLNPEKGGSMYKKPLSLNTIHRVISDLFRGSKKNNITHTRHQDVVPFRRGHVFLFHWPRFHSLEKNSLNDNLQAKDIVNAVNT